jgi:hypothetical protein
MTTPNKNGVGPLRKVLEKVVDGTGYGWNAFTVLSPQADPYRLDTATGHQNGQWFADIVAQVLPYGTIHLRGLHYRLVAKADVLRPDTGRRYVNDDEAWLFLTSKAAKAGRWLGYVPFERIVDERNAPPQLYTINTLELPEPELYAGSSVQIPYVDSAVPHFTCMGEFPRRQPYRLCFIGEKTSLEPILLPIVQSINGELLLPTGEATDTMVAELAARAAQDGRPTVVFYFSDFDPAGNQMPVSVARKLQALRDLLYPDLDIQVHQVALTHDQVRDLGLPSTPLKDTEKRADHWREVMQHEQTEIDALAALQPTVLSALARAAIRPFYDDTLNARVSHAATQWQRDADAVLEGHPDYQQAHVEIRAALETVEAAVDTLGAAQERAREALREVEPPAIIIPEAVIAYEEQPTPLFTSDNDFATASRRLIAHKALKEGTLSSKEVRRHERTHCHRKAH